MFVRFRVALRCVGVAAVLIVSATATAATHSAASCESSAVQAAVNAAASGDIVTVPAGSCSWTSQVSIPDSKKITLQGAGMTSTMITASGGQVLDLRMSGSRVTGFSFSNGMIKVDGDDWRIDHNNLSSTAAFFDVIIVFGSRSNIHPRGLIDHNQISNGRIDVVGWNGLLSHDVWAQPLNLGGSQMVFVEDNTFTGNQWHSAVDGNYGGRYVFRYNTLIDTYIEAHSVQGPNRAVRSWEIYNNTLRQSSVTMWVPMFIRGGTGVVFNNAVVGTWGNPAITLDNVRSFESRSTSGKCDGSSPWDGNQDSIGWPCRDQIGRSSDLSLWTSLNPYPRQVSDPAYFWNNTYNGSPLGVYIHNGSGPWIQSGRDFFNGTPRPGYVPFTYPHPLQSGGQSGPAAGPSAPSNLRISSS